MSAVTFSGVHYSEEHLKPPHRAGRCPHCWTHEMNYVGAVPAVMGMGTQAQNGACEQGVRGLQWGPACPGWPHVLQSLGSSEGPPCQPCGADSSVFLMMWLGRACGVINVLHGIQ